MDDGFRHDSMATQQGFKCVLQIPWGSGMRRLTEKCAFQIPLCAEKGVTHRHTKASCTLS